MKPVRQTKSRRLRVYAGDCIPVLRRFREMKNVRPQLIFADPPFNYARDYGNITDKVPEDEYLAFTKEWLFYCSEVLDDHGAMWVNIPDQWAAEVVMFCKSFGLTLRRWNIWHFRFGQNTKANFINSKVHVLYFIKNPKHFTWNPTPILEQSDRAAKYGDKRTVGKKDGSPDGMRCPFDVWYGPGFNRIQGNNRQRVKNMDNQLPEEYLYRVIASTSNIGDLVLDPFFGSGTSGVVALAMKRKVFGIEHSKPRAIQAFYRCLKGPVMEIPS